MLNVTKEKQSVRMGNVFQNHMFVMEVHQIVQMGQMKRIAKVEYSMKLINQCFSSFYKVKYFKQLKLYSAQFVND